ncbi:MAG: ATP-binding protein [Cyclobacteriaceae bacterium]
MKRTVSKGRSNFKSKAKVDGGGYRGQLSRIRDKFFESIVKAPLAMARFDKKMNYLFATDRWISDYGLDGKNIVGKNHYKIFPEKPDELKEIQRRVHKGEVLSGTEYPFVRSNGKIEYVNWIALPWYDLDQQIKGIDILSELVTSRIVAERELDLIKKKFDFLVQQETLRLHHLLMDEKKLNQMKSDLISLVAHDFRTPLGVILLSMQLLRLDLKSESNAKALLLTETVTKATLTIRDTLNEFLSNQSVYTDSFPISIESIDVDELIQGIIRDLKSENDSLPEFRLFIKFSPPIFTDSFLVKQILRVLLSNAIKFSSSTSKIIIRSKQKSGVLKISIQDFGVGIKKKDQKKIFRAHYRGQNAASYPGSGMGLYIANRLVSFLEGELHFRSRIGHGSTFTLTLKDTVHV